jgi:hypothetical protein
MLLPSLVKVTEKLYMFAFDDGEQNVSSVPVQTSLVVWWSELLTTNHEVPGSIPTGIFLVGGGSPW